MLLKALFFGLLTNTAVAFPNPGLNDYVAPRDLAEGEMEFFSRDMFLEARDLDLADAHGVNTTEMYKHARIKRDDGDDLTIWVNRGFVPRDEESSTDLPKRQSARLGSNVDYTTGTDRDRCSGHDRNHHRTDKSPFSGGVRAIERWAGGANGHFTVTAQLQKWDNLVVGGSNSGANALYRAQRATGNHLRLGTADIRNDADWTARGAVKFGSSWRAQGYGRENCPGGRLKYEIIRTKYDV